MVGARGFEPLTPSASRKCSPPELSARVVPAVMSSERYCTNLAPKRKPQYRDAARFHARDQRVRPGRKRPCTALPPLVDYPLRADVAQLVEHNLAKVGVAGSNPVVRSIDTSEVGPEGS